MSQTKLRLRRWAIAAVAAAALAACRGGDDAPILRLQLTGLEDLGKDAVYEGWLVINGAPVTSGRFSVDAAGKLSQTDFPITAEQAAAATAFVLTIEPAAGDAPAPTDTHPRAGGVGDRGGTGQDPAPLARSGGQPVAVSPTRGRPGVRVHPRRARRAGPGRPGRSRLAAARGPSVPAAGRGRTHAPRADQQHLA